MRFVDELQVVDVAKLAKSRISLSAATIRRWAAGGLLPETTVPQDPFDHVALRWLDEADDLHRGAALGADQGIDLPHSFDQGRPSATGVTGARRVLIDLDSVLMLAVGFRAQAARLVGIPAVVLVRLLRGGELTAGRS